MPERKNELIMKFWDYIVWYPYRYETGYDGIHNGGIKKLSPDAPKEAVKAYREFFCVR